MSPQGLAVVAGVVGVAEVAGTRIEMRIKWKHKITMAVEEEEAGDDMPKTLIQPRKTLVERKAEDEVVEL